MYWFKMHCEARTDAKLRALSDSQHRVWFNMLCLASEQHNRGIIPVMERFILAIEVSGGDVELLESTIQILSKLRIVEESADGIYFLNFVKRQCKNPSDSPEATRERKKISRDKAKECNNQIGVTTMSRVVTSSHDTDIDIDKEYISLVPTVVETDDDLAQNELSTALGEVAAVKPKSKQNSFAREHFELAERLLNRILEHKPNFRVPNSLDQWANTIRLMVEQDRRTLEQIAKVIDWCQKDSFWQVNILSAKALREQFDKLEAKMNAKNKVFVMPQKRAMGEDLPWG